MIFKTRLLLDITGNEPTFDVGLLKEVLTNVIFYKDKKIQDYSYEIGKIYDLVL